uniref:Retinol dehydrogenase 11 n=1 Tax=Cacopsylla melanoneura TaxID=428564 RepID=A0A8D8T8F5_9HEMI
MGIVVKAVCLVFCRYWYIGFPVALLVLLKIYNKLSMGIYKKATLMSGKTVIVTGATSGIGEATAYDLAARGARVILACRDLGKANGLREAIIEATKNSQVVVKKLDLSSLDSVREFAAQIMDEEKYIHVLINNAGTGGAKPKITKDGLQLAMQVNHFGHFLLTNLLLGKIRDSAPSRIINVSSLAHRFNKSHCKQRSSWSGRNQYFQPSEEKFSHDLHCADVIHQCLLQVIRAGSSNSNLGRV